MKHFDPVLWQIIRCIVFGFSTDLLFDSQFNQLYDICSENLLITSSNVDGYLFEVIIGFLLGF